MTGEGGRRPARTTALATIAAVVGALVALPASASAAVDFSIQQNEEIGSFLYGVDATGVANDIELGLDDRDRYWEITDQAGIGQIPATCYRWGTAGTTIQCDPLSTPIIVIETGPGDDRVYARRSYPPLTVEDDEGNWIDLEFRDPTFRAALGPGSDRFRGSTGENMVFGEGGRDRLLGGGDSDILVGGPGRDRLLGRYGSDVLSGGDGRDFLRGGPGEGDLMIGGRRRDVCSGGPGDRVGKCEKVRVKRF